MPITQKEQLLQFMADSLPELLHSHPEAILAAFTGNAPAMRAVLEEAGFSVTERTGVSPDDVVHVHRAEVRAGRLDNGFGSHIRARCDYQVMENPITGKRERVFIYGEMEPLAEAWFRAFRSPDWVDPVTEKHLRVLRAELEKFARAPSDPLLGEIGQAGQALVPTVIAAQIFEEMNERFVLKGLVQVFTSVSPLHVPRRTTQVTVTRGGRATDIDEDKPETGFVKLSHERVGALTYIDPLLAAAAAQGAVRWTTTQLAEAIAKDDQRCIIAGTEANKEPRGVSTLPTTGGQTWDRAKTNAYDDTSVSTERASMKEAFYSVKQRHRERESFLWVANNDGVRELTSHNDADQKPWNEENETYLRKRVIETSALSTVSDDTTIAGGDFSQYAWLEHPRGLVLEQTTVGGDAWESDTIGVKAVQYVDGAPVIPPAFVIVTSVDV